MTEVLFGVGGAALWLVGFVIGRIARRHSVPRHHHVWGNWELVKKVPVTSPATAFSLPELLFPSTETTVRDCMQRECLGCGWLERRPL